MAKLEITGMEEMRQEFMAMTQRAQQAVPRALEAGADVLVKAQQEEAAKLNISGRSKGALVRSIKAGKVKGNSTSKYIEVYPQGVDHNHSRKGVSNAEKGFVLEYGRSNMPGRAWLTIANQRSERRVQEAMVKVWEAMTNAGS